MSLSSKCREQEVEKTLPVVTKVMDRRAAAGGVAHSAAACRGARRRQLGRGALKNSSPILPNNGHFADDAMGH